MEPPSTNPLPQLNVATLPSMSPLLLVTVTASFSTGKFVHNGKIIDFSELVVPAELVVSLDSGHADSDYTSE